MINTLFITGLTIYLKTKIRKSFFLTKFIEKFRKIYTNKNKISKEKYVRVSFKRKQTLLA